MSSIFVDPICPKGPLSFIPHVPGPPRGSQPTTQEPPSGPGSLLDPPVLRAVPVRKSPEVSADSPKTTTDDRLRAALWVNPGPRTEINSTEEEFHRAQRAAAVQTEDRFGFSDASVVDCGLSELLPGSTRYPASPAAGHANSPIDVSRGARGASPRGGASR